MEGSGRDREPVQTDEKCKNEKNLSVLLYQICRTNSISNQYYFMSMKYVKKKIINIVDVDAAIEKYTANSITHSNYQLITDYYCLF